jgi:hypothetical protein
MEIVEYEKARDKTFSAVFLFLRMIDRSDRKWMDVMSCCGSSVRGGAGSSTNERQFLALALLT